MNIIGPVLLASVVGLVAFTRRKKKPTKKTPGPTLKGPEPFQFIIHENQEYDVKVPYRIDFTQMPGGIRWRVFGSNALGVGGVLVDSKATPMASGMGANPDEARIAAITWIQGQQQEVFQYENGGLKVIQNPRLGYAFTVTWDPGLPFYKEARDVDGLELVASTDSSFTFQVTKPIAPTDIREAKVLITDGGLLLGQYKVTVLG